MDKVKDDLSYIGSRLDVPQVKHIAGKEPEFILKLFFETGKQFISRKVPYFFKIIDLFNYARSDKFISIGRKFAGVLTKFIDLASGFRNILH